MIDALLSLPCLVLLPVAADLLVKGASSVAARLGVSPLMIGLSTG
jgi:Ca2+/Na+ antiporter